MKGYFGMKLTQSLCVAFLSLALFTGASRDDVAEDFNAFQRSLMEWMRSTAAMSNKLDELEKKVNQTTGVNPELKKSLQEIADSVGALRNSLSSINARMTKVETALGGATEDNPMVKFGRTLNILKKSTAGLSKEIKEQAAITAVLANRYADFMRPLDPIKKTLAKQREDIDTLLKESSGQKEKLGALESLLVDRLTILEDFLAASEKQSRTLAVLLGRVKNIETNTGVAPPEELFTEKEAAEAEQVATEEEARPKTPEEEGYEGVGDGFYVRDVSFKRFGSSANVTGEIKNLSERDYRLVVFNIMVYNLDNILVTDRDFIIKGIKIGMIKNFNETLTGTNPEDISKYVIRLKRVSQS